MVAIASNAQIQQGDTALVNQAREAVKAQNYATSLDLFLKADKTFAPDTTDYYGNLQHNIGYAYYMLGDKKNAAVYWEKAITVFPQFSDKHGQLLEFLAGIYDDLGDTDNELRIFELIKQHNIHELEKEPVTIKDYLDRAQYYHSSGDQAKAKEWYLKALEKTSTASVQEKEDIYSSYAKYLSENKDRLNAASYYLQAADAREARVGKDRQWALTMYLAAINFQLEQQWQQSHDAYAKSKDAFTTANDSKYVRNTTSGMATCLYFLQRYDEAKSRYAEVLQSLETDKQSADYAKALRNVAKADIKLQQYDEAISYLEQAADIYEKLGDSSSLNVTLTELNNAKVKSGAEYDDRIEQRANAASRATSQRILDDERSNMPLYKLQFGEDGMEYVRSLGLVAELTYELEDKKKGIECYRDYLDKQRKALRHSFVLQTEQERQRTWQEETMTLDSLTAHVCDIDAMKQGLTDSINAMAYDVQLLSKGILLNSSIEFEQVLNDYGDKTLKADYAKAKELDKEITLLRANNGDGSNTERIAQLNEEKERLMLRLMQKCSELGDFTQYLDYTWRDVQKQLGDQDIAIEFTEVNTEVLPSDNPIIALIIAKGLPSPISVPVCPRRWAIVMTADSLVYTEEKYGVAIWDNIMSLLGGCKRVYFSPTAELSSIGIEYLTYKGQPMTDRYEMIRLSSTKELCRKRKPVSLAHVALFGGIDYGQSGEKRTISWRHTDQRTGNIDEEQSGIMNFSPLAGTGKEITQIQKLLKNSKRSEVQLLTGTNASEQTLRQLSGDNNLDVLHIATHGQYVGSRKTTESEAMQCSLLAFSGANIPSEDDANDGIVRAQDVAGMNFRNCKLAVLSACETGLGKLGGDGVFGLQRGFKNAGVHTLLMSLNKVDDAATTELMTRFYKALLETGTTPNAALRKAQQYLRDNGYSSPKYWASFIILDGQ